MALDNQNKPNIQTDNEDHVDQRFAFFISQEIFLFQEEKPNVNHPHFLILSSTFF